MPSTDYSRLPASDQELLRAWLTEFEQSWTDERLARIVPMLPFAGPAHRLALIELVKADLRRQWQLGRQVTVESYLVKFPELGPPEEAPLDLIRTEYEARQRSGVPPSWADFRLRFPRQVEALRQAEEEAAAATLTPPPRQTGSTQAAGPLTPLDLQPGRLHGSLPALFGRYRIERQLGKGGMGAVYLAHDAQLDRPVALKVPKLGDDSPEVLARFQREARAAALLRHPGICPVYDVGEIQGIHYLTMAYLEGQTLAELIRGHKPLPPLQAAEFVRQVAVALEEAHRRGIVHRDLKPSNIMIEEQGRAVVMDFGLARRFANESVQLTRDGEVLGTPQYMSPEQVKGDPSALGPASDIYTLGVILYELLTGHLPFEGTTMSVLGRILTEEPPPPTKYCPDLDSRLVAICVRAMARNSGERYPSMASLANDLSAYLNSADRPPTQVTDWGPLSANRISNAETQTAVPGASSGPSSRSWFRMTTTLLGRRLVSRWSLLFGLILAVLAFLVYHATPDTTDPRQRLRLSGHTAEVLCVAFSPDGRLALSGGKDLGLRLWDLETGTQRRRFTGHTKPVRCVAFMKDGKQILSGSLDQTVRRWDVDSGAELQDLKGKSNWIRSVAVTSLCLTPDGGRLLFGSTDKTVRLLDLASGEELQKLSGHVSSVESVAVTPDGLYAISGSKDGSVRVWNLETGKPDLVLKGHRDDVLSVAVSPDGRRAVSASQDSTVRLWDLNNGTELLCLTGHTGAVRGVAFCPNGRRLLSAGADRTMRLWDLESGREVYQFHGHSGSIWDKIGIASLAVSPDGRWALSGGVDQTVRLWELPE